MRLPMVFALDLINYLDQRKGFYPRALRFGMMVFLCELQKYVAILLRLDPY